VICLEIESEPSLFPYRLPRSVTASENFLRTRIAKNHAEWDVWARTSFLLTLQIVVSSHSLSVPHLVSSCTPALHPLDLSAFDPIAELVPHGSDTSTSTSTMGLLYELHSID
jgi:hypothetical protein